MQEGIEGLRFDVSDGRYELELLMVEPFPKSRRFVDGEESPEHPGGNRIFDIVINDWLFMENLDLLKEYGYNYPIRKRVQVNVQNGKGINVDFNSKKGKPIISAVSLRKL